MAAGIPACTWLIPAAGAVCGIAAFTLPPNAIISLACSAVLMALGSALASIGLTIPAVATVSLLLDQQLALGLEHKETVLLVLPLFTGVVTRGTGRTTVLQGQCTW